MNKIIQQLLMDIPTHSKRQNWRQHCSRHRGNYCCISHFARAHVVCKCSSPLTHVRLIVLIRDNVCRWNPQRPASLLSLPAKQQHQKHLVCFVYRAPVVCTILSGTTIVWWLAAGLDAGEKYDARVRNFVSGSCLRIANTTTEHFVSAGALPAGGDYTRNWILVGGMKRPL